MAARAAQKSEVNITPFVDVMWCCSSSSCRGAAVDDASQRLDGAPSRRTQTVLPVFVSFTKTRHPRRQRTERGGERRLALARGDAARQSLGNLGVPVFVRADRDVGYGDVVRLIDEVRAAGFANVSIVTEDPGA